MHFEYTNALRQKPQLHSLAQNCELEIREVFNDLISVGIIYDPANDQNVRVRLTDVGKSTEFVLSAAELGNERQVAVKLKEAWSALFDPAIVKGAGTYEI
jgi:hypothetical protein